MRTTSLVVMLVIIGCKDGEPKRVAVETESAPAAQTDSATAVSAPVADKWVPKEFTKGIKKFKTPGVYVDGVAKGILKFGELPLSLKPVWLEGEASVPWKKGDKHAPTKIVKQRHYRWAEYFTALGLDLDDIVEMHMYGGSKRPVAMVVTGESLRKNADNFMFRFGSDVSGKPIPACPELVGDKHCPDNIRAIALYIKRTPPIRKRGYFYLNGKRLTDIPYYGTPLRGGVRVYLDGPMVAHVKRHKLKEVGAEVKAEGGYKFFEFLKSQGVDTGAVKEAWLVHKDKFVKRIARQELVSATFVAAERKGGEILFGADKIPTNAIALSSQTVAAKDIPKPEPHEIHD